MSVDQFLTKGEAGGVHLMSIDPPLVTYRRRGKGQDSLWSLRGEVSDSWQSECNHRGIRLRILLIKVSEIWLTVILYIYTKRLVFAVT